MNPIFIGPWLVETHLNSLSRDSKIVRLEPKVMQVLECLARHPGEVVSKEELITTVWRDTFVSEDVLTRSISQLRKVLDDDARQPRFIETISRKGYRLVAPVRGADAEAKSEEPLPVVNGRGTAQAPLEATTSGFRAGRKLAAISIALAVLCALIALVRWRWFSPKAHPTIAVMPFVNLSGDPAEEYFNDGMTEEMITTLSRVDSQGLAVIARTSSMRYKGSDKGVEEIGGELHADYLLEGSVRRSGNRVRVTAQLIRVRGESHLWAEDYDAELKDVLGVQAQISEAVAQAIRIKLTEQKVIPPSVDPEGYRLYLKGRYFLDRPRNPEALRKALSLFQDAVQRDSGFARAWANISLSYELLEYVHGMSPLESHPYALAAASRAIQLDPFSAEAHLAMAYIHEHYEWNWQARDRELAEALRLDPNYELARQWLSYGLLQKGDTEGALIEMRHAISLDPLSPRVNITLAQRLDRAGKHQEAIRQLQDTIDLEPGNSGPHFALARLYMSQREVEKATEEESRALELDNDLEIANGLKAEWKKLGAQAAYENAERQLLYNGLFEIERQSRRGEYVSPSDYAWIYARLLDRENTLRWLKRSYDEHATIMLELRDPAFDFVRDTPEFQEMVQQVGMPGPAAPASY